MRKVFSFIAALCLLAAPAFASCPCGSWSSVTVTGYNAFSKQGFAPSGTVTVTFSSSVTTGASCGSGNPTYGIIDVTTMGGANMAGVLLSARASGATVTVTGSGSCTVNGTVEDIAKVTI